MSNDAGNGEGDAEMASSGEEEDVRAPEEGEVAFPTAEELDAVLDDYQVTEIIGQGGMGAVYRAWQARLERYVAIKVLPEGVGEELGFAEQFRSEARTMANLHHSHIAAVHDFGVVGGLHYLVMEHVDGVTLFDHFYDGTFSPSEIITIILQVCDALDYAHGHHVVHRDIKSANILVGQDGMTKVVDFGLATLQAAPGVLRRRTATGPNFGTPGYSAPELLRAGSHVDHRADIYSLAVVLYEGLTGKTMTEAWTPPSLVDGVAPGIDKVLRKATRTEPQERYQSIDQFATALRELGRTGAVSRPSGVVAPAMVHRAPGALGARPGHVAGIQPSAGFPVLPVVLGLVGVVAIAFFALRGGGGKDIPTSKEGTGGSGDEIIITGLPESPETAVPSDEGDGGGNAEPDPEVEPVASIPALEPVPPAALPQEPREAKPPPALLEAEKVIADELKELDGLFASSFGVLCTKYSGALERLRADAPVPGQAAIDAEIERAKAGAPPLKTDEPGLYPALAAPRATFRVEYDKLVVPDAVARLALLDPHVEMLRTLRKGMFLNEERAVTEVLDEAIGAHEARIAELRALVEERGASVAGDGTEGAGGGGVTAHRAVTLAGNGSETIAPRGSGLGIFAGIHGRITQKEERLAVPPADPGGSWELVRQSTHDFLRTSGIYYQSPRLDFTNATFDVVEWERGGPEKLLISGDRGFPMISGVVGRIGTTTAFAMRYDTNNHNWYCDGKGSKPFTRILVTNVDVGGNTMLSVKMREFPWQANEPEVKMIHSDEGFCVLTALHGPFDGGGEKLLLRIDEEDGFWYLGGQTGIAGLSATATAFILPAK